MDTLTALGLTAVSARTAHTVEKPGPGGERRHFPIFLICAQRPGKGQ
jgi:hypothetical protein